MNRLPRIALGAAAALGVVIGAWAQEVVLPLELSATNSQPNRQWQSGPPKVTDNASGSGLPPHVGQFSSLVSFGGVGGLTRDEWRQVGQDVGLQNGDVEFSGELAERMGRPVGKSEGAVKVILRRAHAGAPYLGRSISLLFGAVIEPPATDENGQLLSPSQTNYWAPQPHVSSGAGGASLPEYYWSPHSRRVYASQSGPISVTWMKAASTREEPPSGDEANFHNNGGNYFRLFKVQYVVSGSPARVPRRIYWTEKSFRALGKPIVVPAARIGAVSIAYNRDLPPTVDSAYLSPGETPPEAGGTTGLQGERRTLWYDPQQSSILAFNRQGLILLELLGDLLPDGATRRSIGLEVVEVVKDPAPEDARVELGERVVPPPPHQMDALAPEPLAALSGPRFDYTVEAGEPERRAVYALRETRNQNDYLVHWMEPGVAGLWWPKVLGRYRLEWPEDVSRYNHYVRPAVATEAEARVTAIPLPSAHAPVLEYQDPLDRPRGAFTDDFRYYTFLDHNQPAHRALLRFATGDGVAFSRVFSWLETDLKKDGGFNGTLASNLTNLNLAGATRAPRFFEDAAEVGHRVGPPSGVEGLHPAGHVHPAYGTAYSVHAYQDPLVSGFDAAARAAILPVNARPADVLEVWWFRTNSPTAGANAAQGLPPMFWPEVIVRYTLHWPQSPPQIVLASNEGSGPLPSLQARGSIYFQNDPSLPGYNPNEEHALMHGGQAYALRDDLNLPDSSEAHVLLEYVESDDRPAIQVFEVRRESDTAKFDYEVTAGEILQPPMPLPLLGLPLAPKAVGFEPRSLNEELTSRSVSTSKASTVPPGVAVPPGVVEFTTEEAHHFRADGTPLALQDPTHQTTYWLYPTHVHHGNKTITGVVSTNRSSPAPANSDSDLPDFRGWQIRIEPVPASANALHGAFTWQDRKGNTWVYRGPHDPTVVPRMAMQYYYRTLPGFHFPSLGLTEQPPVGTITPYLREWDPSADAYAGEAVYGNRQQSSVRGDNNAVSVWYRPKWPEQAPVLQMAETLTVPRRGLPAIRGQTSVQVHYQQSEARTNGPSVVLHDPTRDKTYPLGGSAEALLQIPASIKTETVRGRTHFPLLPPHLSQRFFFDPDRGRHGSLVFRGEYVDDPVGDTYLHLNVLSDADHNRVIGLCSSSDVAFTPWKSAIEGLSSRMELFAEDPAKPGTYRAISERLIGRKGLADIEDDDEAVDSYALTAVGPGSGYVTLIFGDGLAFTPRAEPVTVKILRVADRLYPGELKIVPSSNPLAEQLTLQQVVDLAGNPDGFDFEWRKAAPVDGLPPPVYTTKIVSLVHVDAPWSHVSFPLGTDRASTVLDVSTNRLTEVPTHSGVWTFVETNSLKRPPATKGELKVLPIKKGHRWVVGNSLTLQGQHSVNDGQAVGNFTGLIREVVPGGADSEWDELAVDFGAVVFEALGGQVAEAIVPGQPQSLLFHEFNVPTETTYSQLWLSLNLGSAVGARVYLNGELVVVANLPEGNTPEVPAPSGLEALPRAYLVPPGALDRAARRGTSLLAVEIHSSASPGTPQTFQLRLDGYQATDVVATGGKWIEVRPERHPDGVRLVLGEQADVESLGDNYVIMRYRRRPVDDESEWSRWTKPQLAEGWIKRVLAGINPFNQRVRDLFNNAAGTDASILTAAGRRWEGDIPLNLESANSSGLIEIYETVLRRGRMLSIDAPGGINYGPANDALLLAAGYLNDLYMMLGNEARADAANPTIGIGTADRTYGDIATALFSFRGQVPTLLEEELALLRGRDDFLQPGVGVRPFYNRLPWNYTRGIDAGEVIYALNYNIQEDPNATPDGAVDANDAERMFPQGHGDAYGHYLTALKGYYSLLLNSSFSWVPRIEAVSVLGVPVSVDYQDERKFAAAAAAAGRVGRQIFDLTWRRDFQGSANRGWSHWESFRENPAPPNRKRYWGLDHWASRLGQGHLLNWVVGNALVPAVDPDPTHEGIQRVDRTTVPELQELATMAADLQAALETAEGGLTPLGMPAGSLALDLNPNRVVGSGEGAHFEQIYERATVALGNAIAAFDDAKDVTRLMRSEQDSLNGLQSAVAREELAYENSLIELYGTPYTDDIGPGRTYRQGYSGPDLIHFAYVDMPQITFPGLLTNVAPREFRIDIQDFSGGFNRSEKDQFDFLRLATDPAYLENVHYLSFTLDSSGSFVKPSQWTGRRTSPGRLQEAIGRIHLARNAALGALLDHEGLKRNLDRATEVFRAARSAEEDRHRFDVEKAAAESAIDSIKFAVEMVGKAKDLLTKTVEGSAEAAAEAIPKSMIAGTASGGDTLAPARASILATAQAAIRSAEGVSLAKEFAAGAFTLSRESYLRIRLATEIEPLMRSIENRRAVLDLDATLLDLQGSLVTINQRLQELDDAVQQFRSLVAEGNRVQAEREVSRRRTAAVVHGHRTRDAAFRVFRNEKLERYRTLFEMAARYAFLAANAYDYETGLLDTGSGDTFKRRIIGARALGVVRNGAPQFAGSDTGDPGLSSALAEMKSDWDVVQGRLGFNNPDAHGTTASLRTGRYRIPPNADGDTTWRDLLQRSRSRDVLADPDVRRHCLQIQRGPGLPVPGLILEFSTSINPGENLFGLPLAAGDAQFSPSAFATKIFGLGVALEGYRGMDRPAANGNLGAISPPDPSLWFLDPLALSSTPFVYLVPVGADSIRRPPIGGADGMRSWLVEDVAIPLPFNIGANPGAGGGIRHASDTLTEPLFAIRKHAAFRAVPDASYFNPQLYAGGGALLRSQYTSNRLIGRSAWNSRWKLVIAGHALLHEPEEGLQRLIETLEDIKLHFVTYSYSGN